MVFSYIKNDYCESSIVVAAPGMDINRALAAPNSTGIPPQIVSNHRVIQTISS